VSAERSSAALRLTRLLDDVRRRKCSAEQGQARRQGRQDQVDRGNVRIIEINEAPLSSGLELAALLFPSLLFASFLSHSIYLVSFPFPSFLFASFIFSSLPIQMKRQRTIIITHYTLSQGFFDVDTVDGITRNAIVKRRTLKKTTTAIPHSTSTSTSNHTTINVNDNDNDNGKSECESFEYESSVSETSAWAYNPHQSLRDATKQDGMGDVLVLDIEPTDE
jgi:hypothetical protein